jgi:hypothetical protein
MPRTDLDPECMTFLRQSWARYRDPDVPQAAVLKASRRQQGNCANVQPRRSPQAGPVG